MSVKKIALSRMHETFLVSFDIASAVAACFSLTCADPILSSPTHCAWYRLAVSCCWLNVA